LHGDLFGECGFEPAGDVDGRQFLVLARRVRLQFRACQLEVGFVGSSGINLVDYNHNYNAAALASPSNPINGITTNTVANANLRVPYLGLAASGFQGTGFDGISNSRITTCGTMMPKPLHL
jgi:hypothetical protein